MASDKLIPVNMVIADRTYRLKMDPSDEEVVRKTIKSINEKIVEFKTDFSGKDMQDYVSMVLLWYATEQQKPIGSPLSFSEDDKQAIDNMEALIDRALSS